MAFTEDDASYERYCHYFIYALIGLLCYWKEIVVLFCVVSVTYKEYFLSISKAVNFVCVIPKDVVLSNGTL